MKTGPIILSLLSLFQAACTFFPRATPVPLKSLSDGADRTADEWVILLPGRHSMPAEFIREGFVENVRASRPHARIVVPDLHLGYYRNRSAPDRLHEDVILGARAAGARRITLVGISMGGLGAMLYELQHPGNIDEIVLLSPFLGDDSVIGDIAAQGGLAEWVPQGKEPDAFSRRLWLGLRESWLTRPDRPVLWLGCGRSDRLAAATRLAEDVLSPAGVVWVEGDHDWPTWNRLMREISDQSAAEGSGSAGTGRL